MITGITEMEQTKQRIESSEIFGISQAAEPSRFRTLEYELIENLYTYAQLQNKARYQDMGLELVETAAACLKSYDQSRGPFTHYFSAALARRVGREKAVQTEVEQRGGVLIPEQVQWQISQIQAIAGKMMRDVGDESVIAACARYLEVTEDRVRELIGLNHRLTVVRERGGGEEDAGGIFCAISDSFALEDHTLAQMRVDELLSVVERRFHRCRKSQKGVLSKLLTIRLLTCPPDVLQAVMERPFFDLGIYEAYIRTGEIPTAREVSRQLGKNEASTSRTYACFMAQIKAEVQPVPSARPCLDPATN